MLDKNHAMTLPTTSFLSQGATPKTAVQDDLPNFFSAENFADLEVRLTFLSFLSHNI